ncbi:pre-mRNA-splicing factor CWC22-like [Salvia hispanica]|uniref:pre-mRNA-splicing factor CWC22-like n=1 Tax=Salvia hispanica TaxID=49212 RepID=UPI0020097A3B|nr:pre-mRNA-splicing factor CWC22-like [Salvia hispanica]
MALHEQKIHEDGRKARRLKLGLFSPSNPGRPHPPRKRPLLPSPHPIAVQTPRLQRRLHRAGRSDQLQAPSGRPPPRQTSRASVQGRLPLRRRDADAHLVQLVNQRIANEALALDVLVLLLDHPSSDNVGVAARFCRQCGLLLLEETPGELREMLAEFRGLLRKGELEPMPRLLIGRLFAAYRVAFRESGRGLRVVDDEEQITHRVSLLEHIDPETSLDAFHTNPHLLEEDEVNSNPF